LKNMTKHLVFTGTEIGEVSARLAQSGTVIGARFKIKIKKFGNIIFPEADWANIEIATARQCEVITAGTLEFLVFRDYRHVRPNDQS